MLEKLPPGFGGRWSVGILILVHVIAYNETGVTTTLFSTILASIFAIFAGKLIRQADR